MADTTTPNLALVKIDVGASKDTWGGKLNGNMDAIDAAVANLAAAVNAKLAATGYTAADVLAKLLTVDGDTAGINATTLRGQAPADFAPAASVTAAAILAALLTVDTDASGLNATTLQGSAADAFAAAAHTHPYLPLAGGPVTGDIARQGAGDYLYHVGPAFGSGRVFTTEAGASDPTNASGDIWIKFAA